MGNVCHAIDNGPQSVSRRAQGRQLRAHCDGKIFKFTWFVSLEEGCVSAVVCLSTVARSQEIVCNMSTKLLATRSATVSHGCTRSLPRSLLKTCSRLAQDMLNQFLSFHPPLLPTNVCCIKVAINTERGIACSASTRAHHPVSASASRLLVSTSSPLLYATLSSQSVSCVRLRRFLDHNKLSLLEFRRKPQESCFNVLERTAALSVLLLNRFSIEASPACPIIPGDVGGVKPLLSVTAAQCSLAPLDNV